MSRQDIMKLDRLGLTPREAEVLVWVAQGKSNGVIGLILGISPRTVQKHAEHIYQKLGVETRTAAAAIAFELRETHASGLAQPLIGWSWRNGIRTDSVARR